MAGSAECSSEQGDPGEEKQGEKQREPEEDESRTQEMARIPRLPHDPGRPTRRGKEEHDVMHWPFRPWCRHCVCGRATASPHRSRGEEEREFENSRVPTISCDHCFMGTAMDSRSAHESPFLIVYDNDTESIYAVATQSKSIKP